MSYVHIHLIVNHFLLYGYLFYLVCFAYCTNRKIKLPFLVHVVVQMICLFLLILLNYTGHYSAEKLSSFLQDPVGTFISNHEEWGEMTLKLSIFNVLVHLIGLKFSWVQKVVWIISILTMLMLGITSYYGGQLAHPEIR